jgi:hypothetical protein
MNTEIAQSRSSGPIGERRCQVRDASRPRVDKRLPERVLLTGGK